MFSSKADVSKKDHLLTASLPFRKCGLNHTNIICSVLLNLRAQGARENEFVGSGCVFLWQWSLISKRIALIFFFHFCILHVLIIEKLESGNSKSGIQKEAVKWMCQSSNQAPLCRPYLHYTLLHSHDHTACIKWEMKVQI